MWLPMVDYDFNRHSASPNTTLALAIISACRQSPVPSLPVYFKINSYPVPRGMINMLVFVAFYSL